MLLKGILYGILLGNVVYGGILSSDTAFALNPLESFRNALAKDIACGHSPSLDPRNSCLNGLLRS